MALDNSEKNKKPALAGFIVWLGYEDSNLGMAESESAALPLGDTPIKVVATTGIEPVTPAL